MTTNTHKRNVSPAAVNPAGGQVRVLAVVTRMVKKPVLSEQTRRTLEAVSDPANAHLFTKEAARKAFGHVKI